MKKIIKYKSYSLLSNRYIIISTVLLLVVLNVHSLLSSNILLSGGSEFNRELKYELMLNNYLIVTSIYGLLFSVYLGASVIGPDLQKGSIQIILTCCASRTKYYLGTIIAVILFLMVTQIILAGNLILLFLAFDVRFLIIEVLECFGQTALNSIVIFSVTSVASVEMKGYASSIVGLGFYAYYNMYMFNTVPFIGSTFVIDLSKYRNVLCNFFPIKHILPTSYSAAEVLEYYATTPFLQNMMFYQSLYCILIFSVGALLFSKKEL